MSSAYLRLLIFLLALLMKVKEESENVGLKLNIHKTEIMTYGLITSRQIDGETMETVADFIFLCSKITADGECSHVIKTLASFGKSYDKPGQHITPQVSRFQFLKLACKTNGTRCKINQEKLMILLERL